MLGGRTNLRHGIDPTAQDVNRGGVLPEGLVDAHLVGHQDVTPLAHELVPCKVEHAVLRVARLGGEPHDDR